MIARLLVIVLLVLSVCQEAVAEPLRVGIEAAYPPFSEVDADGALKGFDIDIARAVCLSLRRECVFVQVEFSGLIAALASRKIDAIVASMAITPERREVVDFSDRYFRSAARLLARSEAELDVSLQGLRGVRIGVLRSSIHDRFASEAFNHSELIRYGRQDEAFLDLASGRIDAMVVDSVSATYGFLRTPVGRGFRFHGPAWSSGPLFGEGAGIAVRKGDSALLEGINRALAAMRRNGTYQKIAARYFDFDVYGEDEPASPSS